MNYPHVKGKDSDLCWCAPAVNYEWESTVIAMGPFLKVVDWTQRKRVTHYQNFYHRSKHGRPWKLLPDSVIPTVTSARSGM